MNVDDFSDNDPGIKIVHRLLSAAMMRPPAEWRSAEIDKVAAALCEAQKAMQPAIKDKSNPAFKGTKYADLRAVWEAMGDALQANGLALLQLPFPTEFGFSLRTMLTHTSGQWIASDLPMAPNMGDAQKIGGALTYARRYGASAMVGVYQEDDDGNSAGRHDGSRRNGNANGGGYNQTPAPPKEAPKAVRPWLEFSEAAAAKLNVTPLCIYKDVVRAAIEAKMIPDELRDDYTVIQTAAVLDVSHSKWLRRFVIDLVRENAKETAAA